MNDEVNDYKQQWNKYLSYGYRVFSEKLLTPGIAFIVSSDGSKIIAIGDNTSDLPYEYDQQEQIAYFERRHLRFIRGKGNLLVCPACGQTYIILFEDCNQADDSIIYIRKDTRIFECACGVALVFNDPYKNVSLPFYLNELAPLYLAGMSRTADLFVRYVLSPDGHTLVEVVGAVTQHTPKSFSLTATPFKFINWCNPPGPSFVSDPHGVHDVQLWRTRTYTLGSDTFVERSYHPDLEWWEKVSREVHSVPDNFANQKMIESFDLANKVRLSSNLPSYSEPKVRCVRPRGRPKGTGWYKDVVKFQTALKDVLQNCPKRPTQLQVLKRLDAHNLCRLKPKKPRTQSDTKLLRKWIWDAGLESFEKALEMYIMPAS